MQLGEKSCFSSSHHLAYGETGCLPLIPPKSAILFFVEVIDIIFPNQVVRLNKVSAPLDSPHRPWSWDPVPTARVLEPKETVVVSNFEGKQEEVKTAVPGSQEIKESYPDESGPEPDNTSLEEEGSSDLQVGDLNSYELCENPFEFAEPYIVYDSKSYKSQKRKGKLNGKEKAEACPLVKPPEMKETNLEKEEEKKEKGIQAEGDGDVVSILTGNIDEKKEIIMVRNHPSQFAHVSDRSLFGGTCSS